MPVCRLMLFKFMFFQDLKKPLTLNEAADLCRMYCLSVIFLQYLPLFQRAKGRIITYIWDRTLSPFLRTVSDCMKIHKYCKFNKAKVKSQDTLLFLIALFLFKHLKNCHQQTMYVSRKNSPVTYKSI